ncbi:MAG: biopolymer transporter ExbD [Terricaulis sp.]
MAGKMSAPGHGGGKRGRLEVTADPNVIPFIDVMLVLLIIFMIAAPISTVDVEVEMPTSKIIPSQRPPRPTWISVQEGDGGARYFVMNDEVSIADLGERTFEEWQKNTPTVSFDECLLAETAKASHCRIYIRADTNTAYRNVVRAMNQLQNKGFTRIGLVAEDRRR